MKCLALAALGAAIPLVAGAAETPFSEARLFFELNNSDGDLGVHAEIDGDPWKRLDIEDPAQRHILDIVASGRLRRQGMTQLSFESAEPRFTELAPRDFFARFPEGDYELSAVKLNGSEMESVATISHVLPAPVEGLSVDGVLLPPSCRSTPLPVIEVDDESVVEFSWQTVTQSHPTIGRSGPVSIESYELILEGEEFKFGVRLPGDATDIDVAGDLLESAGQVKAEILVRDENGNRTAIETCFVVAE